VLPTSIFAQANASLAHKEALFDYFQNASVAGKVPELGALVMRSLIAEQLQIDK
jgi:hypothetical protein